MEEEVPDVKIYHKALVIKLVSSRKGNNSVQKRR